MALIRKGGIDENDTWQRLDDDQPAGAGDIIVSLARWNVARDELLAREGRLGLQLEPADEPEDLVSDLRFFALVAVEFPKFTDGRGYSTARLLRERLGFRGELRAIGDVLPDQVGFMQRCGFDAMELVEGRDVSVALAALDEISIRYQATGEELPFWCER
ncbi:MAG: hypothetical protein ACI8TX_000815 [Hyphomicrobiaceae bacterium]|jgi:uncharacterized protein (DUF934 family)